MKCWKIVQNANHNFPETKVHLQIASLVASSLKPKHIQDYNDIRQRKEDNPHI